MSCPTLLRMPLMVRGGVLVLTYRSRVMWMAMSMKTGMVMKHAVAKTRAKRSPFIAPSL